VIGVYPVRTSCWDLKVSGPVCHEFSSAELKMVYAFEKGHMRSSRRLLEVSLGVTFHNDVDDINSVVDNGPFSFFVR